MKLSCVFALLLALGGRGFVLFYNNFKLHCSRVCRWDVSTQLQLFKSIQVRLSIARVLPSSHSRDYLNPSSFFSYFQLHFRLCCAHRLRVVSAVRSSFRSFRVFQWFKRWSHRDSALSWWIPWIHSSTNPSL